MKDENEMGLDGFVALGLAGLFVSAVVVFFAAPESRDWETPMPRSLPEQHEA